MSAIRLDSLEKQLELRDKYFANINAIIAGEKPKEIFSMQDTSGTYGSIRNTTSPEESALRAQVENEEKYNVTFKPGVSESGTSLAELHFFPPVKGIVSSKFDDSHKHYGTDIVTKQRSPVSAALDGTVIFTGWTMETGYVIEIQHPNNIVPGRRTCFNCW
jgi:murein DD-endopeptidase MepM/ murein hydrolase activator NlpD